MLEPVTEELKFVILYFDSIQLRPSVILCVHLFV